MIVLSIAIGDNRYGPSATESDAKVVAVHLDPEESILSPVVTPRVPTDPVLNATVSDTPADDGDDVVGHWQQNELGENTSGVRLEFVGDMDTAGDGPSGEDLGLHVLGEHDGSVLGDLPLGVVGHGPAVFLAGLAWGGGGALAVLAELDGGAVGGFGVLGLIVLARLLGDALLMSELIDTRSVAAFAAASSLAVEDGLDREVDLGVGVLTRDVDTISKSRGGSMSPATTAILGDMLVPVHTEVVHTIDVTPVKSSWEVLETENVGG